MKLPKNAACVVVLDSNHNVLTVTRPNSTVLSLPGGKCDGDESFIDAAIRETQEETGFIIEKEDLIPVYSEIVIGEDGNDFYCVTFLFLWFHAASDGKTWEHERGLISGFRKIEELLVNGAFTEYNIRAFENVNKICSKK